MMSKLKSFLGKQQESEPIDAIRICDRSGPLHWVSRLHGRLQRGTSGAGWGVSHLGQAH
jgi:hypothetical protein